MPLARLREDQMRCDVCGSLGGLCTCTVATTALKTRAEELSRAAFAAVAEGNLHRALALGRESLAIDGSPAKLWQTVGLCALAVGELAEALKALKVASSLDPSGHAAELLQSMESGAGHQALLRYNRALADAQAGRIDDAIESAELVVRELPQFVPGERLLGLLYAERGEFGQARGIWLTALDACRDDLDLLRFLAETNNDLPARLREPASARPIKARGYLVPAVVAAAAVATISILVMRQPSVNAKTSDSASAPMATRADTVALARSLGQILAGESDSAVNALRALEPHTAQWPAAAKARAAAIGQQRGRAHYDSGVKAFNSGQWRAAALDLSWAVTYGAGSDYHAHAMYLLARSHARTSQPASAKIEAQELLRLYPKSRYADGVMRSMAANGQEP